MENTRHQIVASFLFGLFIYVFLAVFQPFGVSEITISKSLYILGFAVISITVLISNFWVVSKYFKTEAWTIKKNILFTSFTILLISILNWLYNSIVVEEINNQHSLIYFVFITFSVGIIPTLFLIHFIEKYLTKRNQNLANNLNKDIQQRFDQTENEEIQILSRNIDEAIKINLQQFICAKSEGNYINVFYKENDKVKSKLLRNSISKLEEQLIAYGKIKKCHRSFIVNFESIDKITGNARNFNLHINGLDFTIPVSRSFPKETLNKLIE